MNRPDFLFRQFDFYELMNSPHPIYILDSSNEENSQKIKEGIKKFKKLNITYQWAPPGNDHVYSLMPLIKEKYCTTACDDDIMIPSIASECADFLENHPDYATCMGKEVSIRFRPEDFNKPYGIIERATLPMGKSFEDEDAFQRARNFWSDPNHICLSVRRVEVERKIRNITKNFFLTEACTEFTVQSMPIVAGKAKILDRLGYIMQISGIRYGFVDVDEIDGFIASPSLKKKREIMFNGLSEIFQEQGKSKEKSVIMATVMFNIYTARCINAEIKDLTSYLEQTGEVKSSPTKKAVSKRLKYFILGLPLFKRAYFKYKKPQDVMQPESPYFKEFKVIRDFLKSP